MQLYMSDNGAWTDVSKEISMMKKVAIVLVNGFADWEYALIAGTGVPFFGLDVRFFTPEPGEIQSQGGLSAIVDQNLDEIRSWQPDALIVIGSFVWATEDAPDIGDIIKTQYDAGGIVAGICGGTLALARAGLLDKARHTSNDLDFLTNNAEGYSGFDYYTESPSALSDKRVITSPGIAPVSFTAAVFESVGLAREDVLQFKKMMAAEHI